MQETLKYLMLTGLCCAGGMRRKQGLPTLAYHTIGEGTPISTSPALLAEQLAYLRAEGYQSLTLRAAHEASQGGVLPEKPVVITFDDGYEDFLDTAVPILREHGMVATVFVVSGRVGGRGTWRRHPAIPALPLMSWDQLRASQSLGIDLQIHTRTHCHLSRLEPDAAYREIADARAALEDQLARPARFLACPYYDCSPAVREAARRAGLAGMCAGAFGIESRQPADWFDFQRMGMDHISGSRREKMTFFRACLIGAGQRYVHLREAFLQAIGRRKPQPWEYAELEDCES